MTDSGLKISRLVSVLIALVTAALSLAVYVGVAKWWGSSDPVLVGAILLFSVFLHEFFHALVIEHCGMRTMMIFVVIGAGVMPIPEDIEKWKKLSHSQLAAVSLSGVCANILIALAALCLKHYGLVDPGWADWVALMNAGLVGFNLIPWGSFDGSKFVKALFDSISEERDHRFALSMTIAIAVFVGIAGALYHQSAPLVVPLIVMSKLRQSAIEDDPMGSFSPKAMTKWQQRIWASVYVALFGGAVLIGF